MVLVLGYFFGRCTVGERCLLRAQYQVAFVGWRVKETNCICVMVNEMTTWGVFFFLAITGR